jgi:hypothetical protein
MSFGLLTAINIDDVPKILRRVAQGYRDVETRRYMNAWLVAADEIEQFADRLQQKIEEAKHSRVRLK